MSPVARAETRTGAEVLYWRAALSRPARGLTLLPERGPPARLDWPELLERARGAAEGLRAAGVGPGEPFLVVTASEPGTVAAILGGLVGDALPTPFHPPLALGGVAAWVERLEAAAAALGARVVVAEGLPLRLLREALPPGSRLAVVDAAGLPTAGPAAGGPEDRAAPAYVQLTSGSTAGPKGVRVSHGNLTANVHQIGWSSGVRGDDVVVSWLPLYHDMGLVGTLVFSLYWSLELVLLSPLSFLRRPRRWLEALSEHRGTLSPAPSFAFSYVAHRLRDADLGGLDLAPWRIAYCGAEPIQPAAVARFVERLAPCGLRPGTLLPCYGLAEATLAVTFNPVGAGLRASAVSRRRLARGEVAPPAGAGDTLELVRCGRPLPEVELELRGPDGRPVGPGRTGRIWLRGPSITAAYHGDPEATAASRDADGWLDTGDVGCLLDGELAVVGRAKDLIVVRGRNHAPQDLEWAAEGVPGVRPGSAAAFGTWSERDATERPVVACEVAADEADWTRGAIARAVYERVGARTGLTLADVVLLAPGAVPRTTSGKVKRARTRELFEEGALG